MASSKKQRIKQVADCWTACKLSVKFRSGFICESPVNNSESAYKLIRAIWDKERLNMQEQMVAFFINVGHQIVGYRVISTGTMDRSYGNPKLIAGFALHVLAGAVIIVHNHPAGSLMPSPKDLATTKQIKDALDLIEVKLLDHLIINEKTYLSMSDEGFM